MSKKSVKLLFYSLFAIDILAGFAVAKLVGLLEGIITAAVLLSLNGVVFAIILKILKIGGENGQSK